MNERLITSPLDSRRFGLHIARARGTPASTRELLADLLASRCDIAIVRVPAATGTAVAALGRHAMQVLHCDTLVYYYVDLTRYEPKAPRNEDLTFRRATPEDREELGRLVAHTFDGYTSHYHGNPLLDPEHILAGYREWGESFLEPGPGSVWVAERGGRAVAFAACGEDAAASIGEGILYGVAPDASGGGIYGDLIRFTQSDFKRRGFASMKVSTQIQNFAVQKVWGREGFTLSSAWDTFHINALLGDTDICYREARIFRQEEVNAFAAVSGDNNPVHVEPTKAQEAGFPGTIVHGVFSAAEISRVLGTRVPGAGTILTHMDIAFLRPILTEAPHDVILRVIGGQRAKGPMLCVFQIVDPDGAICVLGRADIVLR